MRPVTQILIGTPHTQHADTISRNREGQSHIPCGMFCSGGLGNGEQPHLLHLCQNKLIKNNATQRLAKDNDQDP